MPLFPFWHDHRKPIQDECPERGIILREIINVRFVLLVRHSGCCDPTVKVRGAVHLKTKRDVGMARVESLKINEAHSIGREITRTIDRDFEAIAVFALFPLTGAHPLYNDVADTDPTFNSHVLLVYALRRSTEQIHSERPLIFADLEIVDPIQTFGQELLRPLSIETDFW